MSGFVAGIPVPPAVVTNDGFWPDIDTEQLRAAMRLEPAITPARLEVAVVATLISTNRELQDLKASWQAAGYDSLAEVPASTINGESHLLATYRRAAYCGTAAEVAERYRSYDTTKAGETNAEQLTPSVDELRRDARWAIRDLLGASRATVELL